LIIDVIQATSYFFSFSKTFMKKLLTLIALALTGTTVFAQATHSGWYIAPTVGVVLNDSDRAKNTGGAVGLAIGKALNDKWNVEYNAQYLRLDGKNDEQASIGVDGLYFFNRNPDFAPYAVAGLAYAREGYSDTNKNNNLLAKVGLGFTKRLSDTIDFRTDARYQVHGNRAGSGNLGDWVISAGLNIALGPKAQAPAPYVAAPTYVAPAYVAPAPVAVTPPPAAMPVQPAPAPYVAPVRTTKPDRN
jgi:OOP family OmpA-OmpF porin